jgi:iron complex outermembrane receptor protein
LYGKTAYKNAAQTLREGGELSWQNIWTPQWRSQLSMAWLRANYDADFTSGTTPIPSGNRMPAIPSQQLFASLQWADQGFASRMNPRPQGWSASVDWVARSSFWASDVNDAGSKVAGYGAVNLRVRHRSVWGPVRVELWAGMDNLMDRTYVGSVIVNQSAALPQYFEPGMPRNWMTGVKLHIPM